MFRRSFLQRVSLALLVPDAPTILSETSWCNKPQAAIAPPPGQERFRIRLDQQNRPEVVFAESDRPFLFDRPTERLPIQEICARSICERTVNVHSHENVICGWSTMTFRATDAFRQELCVVNSPDSRGFICAHTQSFRGSGPRVIGTAWANRHSARRVLREVLLLGVEGRWTLKLGRPILETAVGA